MVCLLMAPTLCRASIVWWTAAIASLRYFLPMSHYLRKIAILDQFRNLFFGESQHIARGLLKLLLFIAVNVLSLAFCEAVRKNSALTLPKKDDRTIAARLALPRSRDPLFDDTSAEVGINLPVLRTGNRFE